jgi:hypothetical protein
VRAATASYRDGFGISDPTVDKSLIGLNARGGQKMLTSVMAKSGKFAVLLSGDREFIFGDGFMHNITSITNAPHAPIALVPLTPEITIFYTRPMQYRTYPQAFIANLTPEEVLFVNSTVQIYAAHYLFFREICPVIEPAFEKGEHRQFEYNSHPWMETLGQVVANRFFGNDALFYPSAGASG